MKASHRALLEVVREFKPAGMSDLEATFSALQRHADEITRLRGLLKRLEAKHAADRDELAALFAEIDAPVRR